MDYRYGVIEILANIILSSTMFGQAFSDPDPFDLAMLFWHLPIFSEDREISGQNLKS